MSENEIGSRNEKESGGNNMDVKKRVRKIVGAENLKRARHPHNLVSPPSYPIPLHSSTPSPNLVTNI